MKKQFFSKFNGNPIILAIIYAVFSIMLFIFSYKDKIIAVRGNCEAEVDQMVLEFPCMSTYSEVFVDGLKLTLTHGHIYNEEKIVPGASIMLYGHTHLPVCHKKNDIIFFNPGSTSIPKGGNKASFGIYENKTLSVLDLIDEKQMLTLSI